MKNIFPAEVSNIEMGSRIKKCITYGFFSTILFSPSVIATTYYVRIDGGTSTQCTGVADAAYPGGTATNQACAFAHPAWALGTAGVQGKMVGGDTLIINPGQYMIGFGMPNDPQKSTNWTYSSVLNVPPAGPSATNKTKIYGNGYASGCSGMKPQLWGTERVSRVLAIASNTEIGCLELTDHSACIENGPVDGSIGEFPVQCIRNAYPHGPWASTGLLITDGSSNISISNVDIHGLAGKGLVAYHLGDTSFTKVRIIGNGFVGWDSDGPSSDDSYNGTIHFTNSNIEWNGCGEKYPLTTSDLSSSTDKHHCWEQQQGGFGDGIGLGDGSPGNWVITNSSISWNSSDGVDLAHGDGNSIIKFIRSKAEGNNGNQFKSTGDVFIENSVIVGNCSFFLNQSFTSKKSNAGTTIDMNYCRAAGAAISINVPLSSNKAYVSNSTIIGNGDTLLTLAGKGCVNGVKQVFAYNNIFYGGDDWRYNYDQSPSREQVAFYWAGTPCNSSNIDEDYNIVYLTKNNNSGCVGPHSKCGINPNFSGTIKQGPTGNYYTGTDYAKQLTLSSTSTAIKASNPKIVLTDTSNDYLNIMRDTPWDLGAYNFSGTSTSSSNITTITVQPPTNLRAVP